jgi:RNA-directed DNA polymerase
MEGTPRPISISPRLLRIAEIARERPEEAFTSLAHLIDIEHLRRAHDRVRKDAAVGIDGVGAEEYANAIESNLKALHERLREGKYRAPPVRRVWIPKAQGGERPIGVPTYEDKIVQRAVVMVLEAVYEQDFLECSYGFRPNRSAHEAVSAVREAVMSTRGAWVIDADIRTFFDSVDHKKLNELLDLRVRDGSLRRLIGKWLNAGVMEEGSVKRTTQGTPQGSVISPLLANIFLHYVLDTWFERDVRPRMGGKATLVRYCDDFVMIFEREADARRVYEVLPKRLNRFGLSLHPEKTRLVRFERPPFRSDPRGRQGPESMSFLGFTFYWARSRQGNWVVKWKTAKKTLQRFLARMNECLRAWRHLPMRVQSERINRRLRGFLNYIGVEFNQRSMRAAVRWTEARWRYWLSRRCWKGRISWARFAQILLRHPLPPVQIYTHLLPEISQTETRD